MAFNVTLNISYSSSCPQPHSTDIGATCQLIAYSIILIVSIFGNSILIGAISSNNARTQSVMNYYIFNMAAADLLTTVFDMGIQICHYALMVMNRPFEWLDGLTGVFLCKFIVFIQGAAIACSVFTSGGHCDEPISCRCVSISSKPKKQNSNYRNFSNLDVFVRYCIAYALRHACAECGRHFVLSGELGTTF